MGVRGLNERIVVAVDGGAALPLLARSNCLASCDCAEISPWFRPCLVQSWNDLGVPDAYPHTWFPPIGLYEHYQGYADKMMAAIRELLGADTKVVTTLARDGSGLGAALLAASL